MKLLLAMLAGTAILAGSAYAQTQQGGTVPLATDRPLPVPSTSGAAIPNGLTPSGEPGAPNRPRAYGETFSGRPVNPDRVPPLAPGGQGTSAESR